MGKERRRAPRLEANLFANLFSQAGQGLGRAVVTDVSVGGVALETDAQLPLTEKISCSIEIPLEFKATVVRAGNRAAVRVYGLKFEEVSFLEKFLIKRLLRGKLTTSKV